MNLSSQKPYGFVQMEDSSTQQPGSAGAHAPSESTAGGGITAQNAVTIYQVKLDSQSSKQSSSLSGWQSLASQKWA